MLTPQDSHAPPASDPPARALFDPDRLASLTPAELIGVAECAATGGERSEPVAAFLWLVDALGIDAPAVVLWPITAGRHERFHALASYASNPAVLQVRAFTLYASGEARASGSRCAWWAAGRGFAVAGSL
jgi:hypothetical protein